MILLKKVEDDGGNLQNLSVVFLNKFLFAMSRHWTARRRGSRLSSFEHHKTLKCRTPEDVLAPDEKLLEAKKSIPDLDDVEPENFSQH